MKDGGTRQMVLQTTGGAVINGVGSIKLNAYGAMGLGP